tara:strand:+ start:4087 stop:5154 length:1068 start_codon:yes stop_codon:yes gene_type:complete
MLDERKGKPSASDAEANELCPGRHQMSLGMRDQSTPQSLTGDLIHRWLYKPDEVTLEGYDKVIALKCLQQREALMDLMWDDWRTSPPKIIQEERLWYRNEKFSGVPDFVAIRDGICLIADYKTGPIKVANAAENRQLMWLAVLANFKYRFNEVTVSIIQPTCGPATTHTYDKAELVKARNKVNGVLRRMNNGSAFLRAGDKQCKYCKAKELCPALQAKSNAIARVKDVTALTPIQLSEAMLVVPAVREMCNSIENHVREMIESDEQAIPEFELAEGRTTRRVNGPQMALERLKEEGLVSDSGFLESCSVSLPRLAKQIQQYGELSPSEAKQAINTTLHDLISETTGKAKVCRRES